MIDIQNKSNINLKDKKVTILGAGKSGYMLIYASPLYQKEISESLAKKGVIQERFKFNQNGLEVWTTKK